MVGHIIQNLFLFGNSDVKPKCMSINAIYWFLCAGSYNIFIRYINDYFESKRNMRVLVRDEEPAILRTVEVISLLILRIPGSNLSDGSLPKSPLLWSLPGSLRAISSLLKEWSQLSASKPEKFCILKRRSELRSSGSGSVSGFLSFGSCLWNAVLWEIFGLSDCTISHFLFCAWKGLCDPNRWSDRTQILLEIFSLEVIFW